MKVLVAIPAVNNAVVTKECLESVIHHPVDLLLCDNGADQDVKDLFNQYENDYSHKVTIWREEKNIGVNPIWNKFIEYFLTSDYDYLAIINSDIILNNNWLNVIKNRQYVYNKDEVYVPSETDKVSVYRQINQFEIKGKDIGYGCPGIFVWLNKKHATIVYPIPDGIKIWFGDSFIYELLSKTGNVIIRLTNLLCFHHGSETIKRIDEVPAWIEEDKKAWIEKVRPELEKRYKNL